MNDDRLKKIFELARAETPPAAPEGFDARVLAAVRRERRAAPVNWWEQIGELFPRLAIGAALVIALCVTVNYWTALQSSSLAADASELSDQWLFAANGETHE